MSLFRISNPKRTAVILHDAVVTALALAAAFVVRFDGGMLSERLRFLPWLMPPFVLWASAVYWFFGLYKSRWRFASLPDLSGIVKSSTVLALSLLVVDYVLTGVNLYGGYFLGKIAILLYWMLQIFFLGGPRLAYRYGRYARNKEHMARENAHPVLVAGRASDAELVLRAIESGALRRVQAVGVITPRAGDIGQSIRGVPVRWLSKNLELAVSDFAERATTIKRVIVTPSALAPDAEPEVLLAACRRLGLAMSRFQTVEEGIGGGAMLAPVEIEDLLLRPSVAIDRNRLEGLVRGRRVAVTGGGGSIGSEMALRVAAFGASDLLIVENSEPALHQVTETLATQSGTTQVRGVIADIRDRDRLMRVFREFRPDLVFHAAALKHVPYLEQDWDEAIKTNIFGSVNALDAALASGAHAAVMISTDKAIEPVSMLGATKRFAEMYGQALDAESVAAGGMQAARVIAVRFGNVLGSNGSVVPKFKAQIAMGGPVTVTHPNMVRYFMTVREAAELVLTAASHADKDMRDAGHAERPSVYVLKMGQPVRIVELAERMIRLAGFEPGRDIDVAFTGVRPGERLNEILFGKEEPTVDTNVEGVMAAKPIFADRARIEGWLARLREALAQDDRTRAEAVLAEAVPALRREGNEAPPVEAAEASQPLAAAGR
ncbi:MAG: nucleoside-diphosphate sugar epimerase/dehydratase [Alsobacter sp.]